MEYFCCYFTSRLVVHEVDEEDCAHEGDLGVEVEAGEAEDEGVGVGEALLQHPAPLLADLGHGTVLEKGYFANGYLSSVTDPATMNGRIRPFSIMREREAMKNGCVMPVNESGSV